MNLRFAFYGRVSTEDQQDPETSRNWQRTRAQALVEAHGQIVAEYFDIGHSRSLPWKRRTEASRLLAALKDPGRGFDAVVIGEPQRAFYGNQYSLTFPVFDHYSVGLWVPEVGGPIDPSSEAHDLIMGVFGGMSKGERNRIKVRVRSAMGSQAQLEGRYLGGRPPYGYRLVDAGPHPNPGKAADGKRLHTLEPDPDTAPVVQRIFTEYLAGAGLFAIAEALTRDGILSPSAHDRARNPHRSTTAWSKGAVRTILANPRYTGHQVWNKQYKRESLIDVDDVALGHETRLRWNTPDEWIHSETPAHPALITTEEFDHTHTLIQARRASTSTQRKPRPTPRRYLLRGILICGLCHRRMQGNWIRNQPQYRCRYPAEYALANHVTHPANVYLREQNLIDGLDDWLQATFRPDRVEDTLTALAQAQHTEIDPHAQTARETIADCDDKLARYRTALESGADPAMIADWTNQLLARKQHAERNLPQTNQHTPTWNREQIQHAVTALGGIRTALRHAHGDDKTRLYHALGLRLTYYPGQHKVTVEAKPDRHTVGIKTVSEVGPDHYAHALHQHKRLALGD